MQNKNILFLTLVVFGHTIANTKNALANNRNVKFGSDVSNFSSKRNITKKVRREKSSDLKEEVGLSSINFGDKQNFTKLSRTQIIEKSKLEIQKARSCINCGNEILDKINSAFDIEKQSIAEYEKSNKNSTDTKKIKMHCKNIKNAVDKAEKDAGICLKNLIQKKNCIDMNLHIAKKSLKGDKHVLEINEVLKELSQLEQKIKTYRESRRKLILIKKDSKHQDKKNILEQKLGKDKFDLLNKSQEDINEVVKEKNKRISSIKKEQSVEIQNINNKFSKKIKELKSVPNSKELIGKLILQKKSEINLIKKQKNEEIKNIRKYYMEKILESKKSYDEIKQNFVLPVSSSKSEKERCMNKSSQLDLNTDFSYDNIKKDDQNLSKNLASSIQNTSNNNSLNTQKTNILSDSVLGMAKINTASSLKEKIRAQNSNKISPIEKKSLVVPKTVKSNMSSKSKAVSSAKTDFVDNKKAQSPTNNSFDNNVAKRNNNVAKRTTNNVAKTNNNVAKTNNNITKRTTNNVAKRTTNNVARRTTNNVAKTNNNVARRTTNNVAKTNNNVARRTTNNVAKRTTNNVAKTNNNITKRTTNNVAKTNNNS